jgi:hypothetical protein
LHQRRGGLRGQPTPPGAPMVAVADFHLVGPRCRAATSLTMFPCTGLSFRWVWKRSTRVHSEPRSARQLKAR